MAMMQLFNFLTEYDNTEEKKIKKIHKVIKLAHITYVLIIHVYIIFETAKFILFCIYYSYRYSYPFLFLQVFEPTF